jgi:site-specific recombinase
MLQGIANFFRQRIGKTDDHEQKLIITLEAFRNPDADTLELIRRLIALVRPKNLKEGATGERQKALLARLQADPELLAAFRQHIVHFLATRRLVTFFTDSGILPGTGFFSEWWRILWNRILPEVPDERRLKDCLHVIYDRSDDWRWLEQQPAESSQQLWALLAPNEELRSIDWLSIQDQILDSVLLIAHRVSGLGVDSELMRAAPDFDENSPRFIALSAEALDFVNAFRQHIDSEEPSVDDGSQLLVMADQCQETLERIRKRALTVGTSLHLSYILSRSEQSLERLRELVAILIAADRNQDEAINAWSSFAREAFLAENRRNSMRYYMSQLSRLMAVRVTENAARSGEHYICETKSEYQQMWRSAAGAGVLIGGMALLKIYAAALHAPLFVEAFLFSMIYGLGFVLIYLLGMTVATKQPAMTAQTLASHLSGIKPNRAADLERVVDVVAAVSRSQLAAIGGNVMLALPIAIGLGWGLSELLGAPVISMEKGAHLLQDLDPLGWAIPHAAVAGCYLFLSGLITGYFDNQAAYSDFGARIARLHWLRKLLDKERALRFGNYLQERMGGIMGNFLFGCMLGSTGVIGIILGLPLDIRHIAFSSANIGYAVLGFDFELPLKAVLWGALGIALIGMTNLAVSFALALRTALRARRVEFEHWMPLLGVIWRRFRQHPRSFLLPPRE